MRVRARRRSVLVAVFIGLACAAGGAACRPAEDARADHERKALEHVEAGRITDALIELNNALRLAPDDAGIAERIANLLVLSGKPGEARFYYAEAYRADPSRVSSAVEFIGLERGADPAHARELLEELRAQHPDSPWTAIATAEQALFDGDTGSALAAARRAIELAPEEPAPWFELARVHTARIREQSLAGRVPEDAVYREALEALDRFEQLDENARWRALSERARILASWLGHLDEAEAAVREAVAEARRRGLPSAELQMLRLATELGRSSGRHALQEWALERTLELEPRAYDAWQRLAVLHAITGRSATAVHRRMVQTLPDDPEAHRLMARHLAQHRGLDAGIRYLDERAQQGIAPAAMLAEKARLYFRAGEPAAAARAVSELESAQPEARETQRLVAWRWIMTGRPEIGLRLLLEQPWTQDDPAAQRLLVDGFMRFGDPHEARKHLGRVLELTPRPERRLRSLEAQLRLETGDPRGALAVYSRLMSEGPLDSDEQRLMATALYEIGAAPVGRGVLEKLVDRAEPDPLATRELFLREGAQPELVPMLRRGFARLVEERKRDPEVLAELAHFEIAAGTPERAQLPLLRAVRTLRRKQRPSGRIELLQVELKRAMGNIEGARRHALSVLEREPTLPGALATAASLYPSPEDARAEISRLTEGVDPKAIPAPHHALLGRLYHRVGNEVMARWSLEQALSGGVDLPILKNDLAFMLAKQGVDLKRAALLARQASRAMPDEAGALDTLGFVLLQMGDAKQAAVELQRAIAIAERTGAARAELLYHLGLAYARLERPVEAEDALQKALALGEDFPDAEAARHQLAVVRGEI